MTINNSDQPDGTMPYVGPNYTFTVGSIRERAKGGQRVVIDSQSSLMDVIILLI